MIHIIMDLNLFSLLWQNLKWKKIYTRADVASFTLAKTKIIYPKNVWAKVAMDKYLAPSTIEKMKILEAILELPAKQHCQSSPLTGQVGQIASAV